MTSGYVLLILGCSRRTRRFSTSTDSSRSEFSGANAYDILGVLETSSFAEIKASFRKLAKKTHPDLARSENTSASSQRFVQILAAYEILSHPDSRAQYDRYLLSQRMVVQHKQSRQASTFYIHKSQMTIGKNMEVVEWLKWYRSAIQDILSEKKVTVGTGYFDVLEADFYSSIHAAYYGPLIESLDLLPDCFEAEERSVSETREVLHLVSGRDLFGMVCLVNKVPELSFPSSKKLHSFTLAGPGIYKYAENANIASSNMGGDKGDATQVHPSNSESVSSNAYDDLELHVCGRVIALATRVPPKSQCGEELREYAQDQIHVFLNSDPMHFSKEYSTNSSVGGAPPGMIPLGTIIGLGTSPEEGSCFVYDNSGTKTHVIIKHRTLMVKHMQWYAVIDKVPVCECRCSRARLPPSKFWLFEPRSGLHDIGGWYVETFGRDKKGRAVPSQRYWDGIDGTEQNDKTLDIEDAKRRKWTVSGVVEGQLFRILQWCKKLV